MKDTPMSHLFMVRHAQASFGSADYDQLSGLGEEQARRLGKHWAEQQMDFDEVFTGPRRRHGRTAELVGTGLRQQGLPWPEPKPLPELDEYAGLQVFRAVLAQQGLGEGELASRGVLAGMSKSGDSSNSGAKTELLKHFQAAMASWVRGELAVPGVETWREFRTRARSGLDKILAQVSHGRRIVIFTSTGPVAAALDLALGLEDEVMMETSWQLRNTSVTEFLSSPPRFTLSVFNSLPHVSTRDLMTHI